jgi:hypothetical protein
MNSSDLFSAASGVSGASGFVGGPKWSAYSSTHTTYDTEGVLADTSLGGWTVTLPITPALGNTVSISDQKGTFATNNLTIGRNGENIQGFASNLVCNMNDATFELVYTGTDDGWKIRTYPGSAPSGYSGYSGQNGLGQTNVIDNSNFFFRQRGDPIVLTDDTYGADRWNTLTQTAGVSGLGGDGAVNGIRYFGIKQYQASAQRAMMQQIIPREKSLSMQNEDHQLIFNVYQDTGGAINFRYALLWWSGTADAVTSDVVADWTSGTYTFLMGRGTE